MDLHLDPKLEVFRQEVRSFIKDKLPEDVAYRARKGVHPPREEDRRLWNKILNDKGWAAPGWPVEEGGPGWSPMERQIFEMECRMGGCPELRWQGLRLIGPVIYTFGTAAQKQRYLPKILSGEEQWAQGFSEPEAGSDLASLRTTAVLDGDEWVINGQKLWTSEAYHSEMGFFLCRTKQTEKPQGGISMLLVDMRTPGVTVRPIQMINGDISTAEVFLDNVRVPKDALLGERESGWAQTKFLLGNERTSSADMEKTYADLAHIKHIAHHEMKHGNPLIEDKNFRRQLTALTLEAEALDWTVLRVLSDAPSNFSTGARASVLKLRGSSLQQRITEFAVASLGQRGLRLFTREQAWDPNNVNADWPVHVPGTTSDMLYARAFTIYGGAMEVQKNIIAKVAFGL